MVNPIPVPTITGPSTVCAASTGNVYTTQPGMTAYTWAVSAGGTITAGAGTNAITVTWGTGASGSVSVTYTSAAGCQAANPVVLPVTINPTPVVTGPLPLLAEICSGQTFNVLPSGVPAGTLYSWNIPTGSGFTGGTSGNAQASISGTLFNTTTASVTATYTVTPVTGICTGQSFDIVVTVNPVPVVSNLTPPDPICSGESFSVEPTNVPVGTLYSWNNHKPDPDKSDQQHCLCYIHRCPCFRELSRPGFFIYSYGKT
jgi:hypothetical protein